MRGVRRWSAGVLLVIGVILSPIALTGIWAKTTLTDTDAYVEAVAPLADDPNVTDAMEARLLAAVMNVVEDVSTGGQVNEYLDELNLPSAVTTALGAGLAALTESLREPISNVIHQVLTSQGFVNGWEQLNRVAHQTFVDVMEGESALVDTDGNLALQLEPVLELVREQLVAKGYGWASEISASDMSFVVAEAGDVETIRTYYELLVGWSVVAVIVTVAALVAAVLLARERMLGVIRTFIALSLAMVVFRVLMTLVVGAAADSRQNPEALRAIFGTVTSSLTDSIRLTAIGAMLIALIVLAWLKRQSIFKRIERLRAWRVRSPALRAGSPALRTGRVMSALIAAGGAAWLLFAGQGSAVLVIVVVLAVLGGTAFALVPDRLLGEELSDSGRQS